MYEAMTGPIDGRRARRQRNRDEVVDAAIALLDDGVFDPTVDQLTDRSGLSARSIFRYFDGLDDLRRAVIRRHLERVRPMLDLHNAGDGSLDSRIKRFVDTRVKFNESIEGPARAAQSRALFTNGGDEDTATFRELLDDSVRRHFAPEFKTRAKAEADDLAALIGVIVSFDGWDRMTRGQGRSRNQVKRAWTLALESLLAN